MSFLSAIGKEIGKGALQAVGNEAATAFFDAIGAGGGNGSEALLRDISNRLDSIDQGIARLHDDMTQIDRDLQRIDRDIVEQNRKNRMQKLAQEISHSEIVISEYFERLMLLGKIHPNDRKKSMGILSRDILRNQNIRYRLDLIHKDLLGAEGSEGALQLLGDYYESDIQMKDYRKYDYVRKVYDSCIESYFTHRIGMQMEGIILLLNALSVDPDVIEEASREANVAQARESFAQHIRQQCERFVRIAQRFSLYNWPYEFLYYKDGGIAGAPYYEEYLTTSILAKADSCTNAILGGDGQITIRIYVSHCVDPFEQLAEFGAVQRVTEAILKAIQMKEMKDAAWWNHDAIFPQPTMLPSLTEFPSFPEKLIDVIEPSTGQSIVHVLPSEWIDPNRPDFLEDYLDLIRTNLPTEVACKVGQVPIFSPSFKMVRFPVNEQGNLAGSINIPTYYNKWNHR